MKEAILETFSLDNSKVIDNVEEPIKGDHHVLQ